MIFETFLTIHETWKNASPDIHPFLKKQLPGISFCPFSDQPKDQGIKNSRLANHQDGGFLLLWLPLVGKLVGWLVGWCVLLLKSSSPQPTTTMEHLSNLHPSPIHLMEAQVESSRPRLVVSFFSSKVDLAVSISIRTGVPWTVQIGVPFSEMLVSTPPGWWIGEGKVKWIFPKRSFWSRPF